MNLIMDEIMEFLKETSHSYELVQFEIDTLLKSVKNNVGISKFRTGLTQFVPKLDLQTGLLRPDLTTVAQSSPDMHKYVLKVSMDRSEIY